MNRNKTIPGFSRYTINYDGKIHLIKTGTLVPMSIKSGIPTVILFNDNGLRLKCAVVKLLLITFTALDKDTKVSYRDKDPCNVSIYNLRVTKRHIPVLETRAKEQVTSTKQIINTTNDTTSRIFLKIKDDIYSFANIKDLARSLGCSYRYMLETIKDNPKAKPYVATVKLGKGYIAKRYSIELYCVEGEYEITWLDGTVTDVKTHPVALLDKTVIVKDKDGNEKEFTSIAEISKYTNVKQSVIQSKLGGVSNNYRAKSFKLKWKVDERLDLGFDREIAFVVKDDMSVKHFKRPLDISIFYRLKYAKFRMLKSRLLQDPGCILEFSNNKGKIEVTAYDKKVKTIHWKDESKIRMSSVPKVKTVYKYIVVLSTYNKKPLYFDNAQDTGKYLGIPYSKIWNMLTRYNEDGRIDPVGVKLGKDKKGNSEVDTIYMFRTDYDKTKSFNYYLGLVGKYTGLKLTCVENGKVIVNDFNTYKEISRFLNKSDNFVSTRVYIARCKGQKKLKFVARGRTWELNVT